MLAGLIKMTLGFMIGRVIGTYCARNELSPILGIALTVACVLLACTLVDQGFGNA